MAEAATLTETDISVVEKPYDPIFVVGMNGSGTTMVVDSLSLHPDLYGFRRETRVIPYLISQADALGDLNDDQKFYKVWEMVCNIPEFTNMNNAVPPPIPSNWKDFPRDFASVLDAVFRYFAASEGKTRWCEKTPQHIQHMPALQAVFPNAKFIHLIRDGRDGAASFHRRWKRTPELTLFRWKKVVSAGMETGKTLGDNYFELKYEDLTESPELWMRKICKFLSVDYHEDVIKSRHPQSEKFGSIGKIEKNSAKWKKYFKEPQLSRLESIAGAQLASLGYSVSQQGDLDPSGRQIKSWKLMDHARQYRMELSSKIQGKSDRSWLFILKLPLISYKQSKLNRH